MSACERCGCEDDTRLVVQGAMHHDCVGLLLAKLAAIDEHAKAIKAARTRWCLVPASSRLLVASAMTDIDEHAHAIHLLATGTVP